MLFIVLALVHVGAPPPPAHGLEKMTPSPQEAWDTLAHGNELFATNQAKHPAQNSSRRAELLSSQSPIATVFGCSDSRVPAELVFDRGLGELFGVRTAGHVLDAGVIGSLEYSQAVLKVPLLVVLGHESCGAVKASVDAIATGSLPGGFIRDVVQQVMPSLVSSGCTMKASTTESVIMHVRETMSMLTERSVSIRQAVDDGSLAIVGAIYRLSSGRVDVIAVDGDVHIPLA